MIGILNYGTGNIKAFSNIYKSFGISIRIIEEKNDLEGVSKIVLPGVGSFDRVLEKLRSAAFFNLLEDLVLNKEIPILGICVGMQIMAQRSDEGVCKGLGWIGGEVHHLSKLKTNKQIPHMGWNQINFSEKNELFSGIKNFDNFYFLHSYFFQPTYESDSVAKCCHSENFCVAVNRKNIYGVQFHPEKSHQNGIQLLKNFAIL